jgi:thiaminase
MQVYELVSVRDDAKTIYREWIPEALSEEIDSDVEFTTQTLEHMASLR